MLVPAVMFLDASKGQNLKGPCEEYPNQFYLWVGKRDSLFQRKIYYGATNQ